MIIFQSDRVISREQADVFPPGWTFAEAAVPSMTGPLVDYLAQLGDG